MTSILERTGPSIELINSAVYPHYHQMLLTNAPKADEARLDAIVEIAHETSTAELLTLFHGDWRAEVMAGWIARATSDRDITTATLTALAIPTFSLTVPPLAAAAITLAEWRAMPSLVRCYAGTFEDIPEAAGFVRAATQHLAKRYRVENPFHPPPQRDRVRFEETLEVAQRLASKSSCRR